MDEQLLNERAADRLELSHVKNARTYTDVRTKTGQRLAPGLLLRTGRLKSARAADVEKLAKRNVKTVIDLRLPHEVAAAPDQGIPGADMVYAPMASDQVTAQAPTRALLFDYLAQHDDAFDQMRAGYRNIVADPDQQKSLALAFTKMVAAPGAVLWHCSMGKDRTGVLAALLLDTLGVSRDFITADYLYSNVEQADHVDRLVAAFRADGATAAMVRNIKQLACTDAAYLDAMFDWVYGQYGDTATYLAEGLGLRQVGVTALRHKFLQAH